MLWDEKHNCAVATDDNGSSPWCPWASRRAAAAAATGGGLSARAHRRHLRPRHRSRPARLPARPRPAGRRSRRAVDLGGPGAARGRRVGRRHRDDRRGIHRRAVPVHAAPGDPPPPAGRPRRAARSGPGRQADAAHGAVHDPCRKRGLCAGRGAAVAVQHLAGRRPVRPLRPSARPGQSGAARRRACSAAAASCSSPGATITAATARRWGSATGWSASRIAPPNPALAGRILATFLADRQRPIKEALLEGDLARARRLVNGGRHGLDRFTAAYRIGDDMLDDPVWTRARQPSVAAA